MPNFIGDFFENRGWMGLMQYNATTGQASAAGTDVPPATPIAWADFITLDWTQLDGLFYLVTDVHSVGTTGGSLWMADATGDRPILKDGPLQYTDLNDAPSPLTYPGLRVQISGLPGRPIFRSDGTYYRSEEREVTLKNIIAPVAHAGATLATDYLMASAVIPRDINNKSMLRDGDYIRIQRSYLEKAGTADKLIRRLRWGTAGTTADTQLITTTNSNTTDLGRIDERLEIARRSATTIQARGAMQGFVNSGAATTAYPATVTVGDMDSTLDTYFSLTSLLDGLVGDTSITLRDFEIVYVRGY